MERGLTQSEFRRFHDFIYSIAGIHYPDEKLELLSDRVRRRIQEVHETSYDAYLLRIGLPDHKRELQAFLDSITTNET
jgi:chemotaxis methyl-accepting protein methylase